MTAALLSDLETTDAGRDASRPFEALRKLAFSLLGGRARGVDAFAYPKRPVDEVRSHPSPIGSRVGTGSGTNHHTGFRPATSGNRHGESASDREPLR